MFGKKQDPRAERREPIRPAPPPPPPPLAPPRELLDILHGDFDRLLTARKFIEREIAKRSADELETQKSKLSAMASSLGLSIGTLFGVSAEAKKERKKRGAAETKLYRNPDNAGDVYKGKGKRPAWLQARLDAGEDLETFRVKEESAPV